MGIQNRLAKVFRRLPPAPPPTIQVTQDGLRAVYDNEVLASVLWSDIVKIITYKYDLISTDKICIGFLTSPEAESWFEISEDWSGFVEAVSKMEELYPSISENWYGEVMVPAFERKETVLWESS